MPPSTEILEQNRALADQINQGLLFALMQLHGNNKDLDLDLLDLFALGGAVSANPSAFGFTNSKDACLVPTVSLCSNPDEYLYWDDFHPTAGGLARFPCSTPTAARSWPSPRTTAHRATASRGTGFDWPIHASAS